MKITVKFDSQLRRWSNAEQLELKFKDEPTIAELFESASKQADSELRSKLLTTEGLPQKTILVFINGTALPTSSFQECNLKDGDEVALFPPISGG